MRKFLIIVTSFLLTTVLLAVGVELVLYNMMENKRAHVLEDWPDLRSMDVDVLFVGNSRIAGHVIPRIVQEESNLSAYNIAYDGYSAQMGAYRLQYVLEHAASPPKFVVAQTDMAYISGDGRQSHFSMKDGMLRYFLLDQTEINKYFRPYENWREADAWIPLLRYKGYPLIFFKHLAGWNRWDKRPDQGYWHKDKAAGFELDAFNGTHGSTISFCGIDSICKAQGIQLICLIPPSPAARYRPDPAVLDSLNDSYLIWDFSDLFEPHSADYFYDQAHFNATGAQMFSSAIGERFQDMNP